MNFELLSLTFSIINLLTKVNVAKLTIFRYHSVLEHPTDTLYIIKQLRLFYINQVKHKNVFLAIDKVNLQGYRTAVNRSYFVLPFDIRAKKKF